jgi:2-keto-4-pentenoate hydratase
MTNIEEVARILSTARRDKRLLESLPASCKVANNDEALVVQRRIMELLGGPIGGWKAALPQPRGPFVAPLPTSAIVSKSPCPILLHDGVAKIEPEVAFVMGRDLPPREQPYVESDLRQAIARTHMVLELIGSRFSDPAAVPFPDNLADCIQNQALFVGPEVLNALDRKLDTLRIRIASQESVIFERDTQHPNGHPLTPLVWLANFLSGRKETLRAGQIVTTGSYAGGVVVVPIDTPLTIEYGGVGSLSVHFTDGRS